MRSCQGVVERGDKASFFILVEKEIFLEFLGLK